MLPSSKSFIAILTATATATCSRRTPRYLLRALDPLLTSTRRDEGILQHPRYHCDTWPCQTTVRAYVTYIADQGAKGQEVDTSGLSKERKEEERGI